MSTLFGKSKRKRAKASSAAQPVPVALDAGAGIGSSDDAPPHRRTVGASTEGFNAGDDALAAAAISTFEDLQLCPPLLRTCAALGYRRPTPVQRTVIPAVLSASRRHILALSATGSGKTAAFALPMLHALSHDPYGIFGVVLTPTRELAKQIVEQIMALGAGLRVKAALVVGGMDMVRQACELSRKPHFVVATPGRLAALLRGPNPPALRNVRYVVLDEADRLLAGSKSGFERDVAEVLLHSTTTGGGDDGEKRVRRARCQTLMFSATLTRSLASLEEMAGAGLGRLPLQKFVIRDDETGGGGAAKKDKKRGREEAEDGDNGLDGSSSTSPGDDLDDDDGGGESSSSAAVEDETSIPRIPAGLRQEYVFMPSKVRDAYLLTAIRTVMANGGRRGEGRGGNRPDSSGWNDSRRGDDSEDDDETTTKKARSAIVFVSTCERAALVSGILTELGISNVALHSLLSQNRRLASLAKFKSQQSRVLVATDVASRGLDIPTVDLVLNAELPRRAVDYVHRVGRTARAGRRGRAISLVGERDVALVHAAEKLCGRGMEKCPEVTDDAAVRLLGSVAKAARLARMKLMDVGFDDLVKRMKERKARDRRERSKAERAARRVAKKARSAASS